MPYKKPERVPLQGFSEYIRGRGFTSPQLAKVLGCSPNTAMRKLKNPTEFSLGDLLQLHRKGHIVWDDLKGAIRE